MASGSQAAEQAAKRAVWQNHDLIGAATLGPQINLPETPSYTEGETLKAKSEGFQDYMGWFKSKDTFVCLGTFNESWLTPYIPVLIYGRRPSKDY